GNSATPYLNPLAPSRCVTSPAIVYPSRLTVTSFVGFARLGSFCASACRLASTQTRRASARTTSRTVPPPARGPSRPLPRGHAAGNSSPATPADDAPRAPLHLRRDGRLPRSPSKVLRTRSACARTEALKPESPRQWRVV